MRLDPPGVVPAAAQRPQARRRSRILRRDALRVLASPPSGRYLGDRQFRRYRLLRRAWRIEWPVMAEIARVGSPIAVTEIAEMGMFFATTLMMGLLGVDALAAHAVTAQCYAVVFMIPVGLAQAAAVRVGRATGARY